MPTDPDLARPDHRQPCYSRWAHRRNLARPLGFPVLTVAGDPSPDIRGTYTYYGTHNANPVWKHTSLSYYLCFNADTSTYDINNAPCVFTSEVWRNQNPGTNPNGTYDPFLGCSGNPIVTGY